MLHVMERAFRAVQARARRDEGQTLVEYALILGLVALALVGALTALQVDLSNFFGRLGAELDGAGS